MSSLLTMLLGLNLVYSQMKGENLFPFSLQSNLYYALCY